MIIARHISAVAVAIAAIVSWSGIHSAQADEVIELGCFVVADGPDGKPRTIDQNLKVLEQTRSQAEFMLAAPEGYKISGVWCNRSDPVPTEFDYKVLLAGFPFYIFTKTSGMPYRLGVLEIKEGGVVSFDTIEGAAPTPEMLGRLQVRLDQLQTTVEKAVASETGPKK